MGVVSPPCCAVFSFAGALFLLLMGLLLSSSSHVYVKGVPDAEEAARTCYKGAALYGGTLAVSVLLLARGRGGGVRGPGLVGEQGAALEGPAHQLWNMRRRRQGHKASGCAQCWC